MAGLMAEGLLAKIQVKLGVFEAYGREKGLSFEGVIQLEGSAEGGAIFLVGDLS